MNAATAGSGTAWTGATGATPPNGWTVYWAGLFAIDGSSGSGAEPGLKITVDTTPAETPGIIDSWTVGVGKLYQFSFRFKNGASATGGIVYLGTSVGSAQYNRWDPTSGSWATYTHVFEATSTDVHVGIRCDSAVAGQHCWYDSVMLHEITPGCVAADALAFDGWYKQSNNDLYRQHSDAGTLTRDGSFYSLKSVTSAIEQYVSWPVSAQASEDYWQERFAGRTVTFGCWVKASNASHARIAITDGVGTDYSSYHTGGGAWEWLEITRTCSAAASSFRVIIYMNVSGATSYISQPMLVFGSAIGSGNYSRPMGEIVNLENQSFRFTDYANATMSAADDEIINVEAQSEGKIPKGVAAIQLYCSGEDSAVADGVGFQLKATSADSFGLYLAPQVNNLRKYDTGWVTCDSNGDVYFMSEASGTNTLSLVSVAPLAVQLR